MTKLTQKQWIEIKAKYQMGKSIREIAREYNYDSGNLSRKAKKEGWVHGEIQHLITAKANAINEVAKTTAEIQQATLPKQQETIEREVLVLAGLKQKSLHVQYQVMDLVNDIVKQTIVFVANNQSGLYIKSQSETGITYGRNSEIVKDLAPILNGINSIINPKSDITVNNNQQNNMLIKLADEDYPGTDKFIVDRQGNITLDADGNPVNPESCIQFYLPVNNR
ncbi:MAG: hypothetical protein K0R94_538 [Burkholderiales bacterium]|jgi:hypothetical protein|nr:hypothetical protein [Burkholderiales bacterium]